MRVRGSLVQMLALGAAVGLHTETAGAQYDGWPLVTVTADSVSDVDTLESIGLVLRSSVS